MGNSTFKKRYPNHKKAFNEDKYKQGTGLSGEFWRIKRIKR